MADAPSPHDSKQAWLDYALDRGLDADEASALSRDELVARLSEDEDEAAYQDQGSLDAPTQSTSVEEAAADVGTPELRDEAAARVGAPRRKPFPWEVGPPKS